MKVHLITSRPTLEKDIDTLRRIVDMVRKSGHELVYEWIEDAYRRTKSPDLPYADWSRVYKDNLAVINKADVVIAESTYENFGVGYQVAVAVQLKKPVLLLRHASAGKDGFATGIEDGWVVKKDYSPGNLPMIVNEFISVNDIQTKDMRFNFFIDRTIYNYLRWASHKTGKTKAEILRDLVSKEIEKETEANV